MARSPRDSPGQTPPTHLHQPSSTPTTPLAATPDVQESRRRLRVAKTIDSPVGDSTLRATELYPQIDGVSFGGEDEQSCSDPETVRRKLNTIWRVISDLESSVIDVSDELGQLRSELRELRRQQGRPNEDQIRTQTNWVLRYARRLMIMVNLGMSGFAFMMAVLRCFKLRGRYPVSFLARMLQHPPKGTTILPITGLLQLGMLNGIQESCLFQLATIMLTYDTYPWRKYAAAFVSALQSLAACSSVVVREPYLLLAHKITIVLNILYGLLWLMESGKSSTCKPTD